VGQGWLPGASGVVVEEALTELSDRGARTFIVTAIERDGLLAGPNLELLGRMVALDRGAIVASAGVSSLVDLTAVRRIGCVGAVIGRAIFEGRLDLAEAVHLVDTKASAPGFALKRPSSRPVPQSEASAPRAGLHGLRPRSLLRRHPVVLSDPGARNGRTPRRRTADRHAGLAPAGAGPAIYMPRLRPW